MSTRKVPVPNRQLRQHNMTVHHGHILSDEQRALLTLEERNHLFLEWWYKFKRMEFPKTLKYLCAGLEYIPEHDHTGKPNAKWGQLHVGIYVSWTTQTRMSQKWNDLFPLAGDSDKIPKVDVQAVGNASACIDYNLAEGVHANKPQVDNFEYMPFGVRPFANRKARQALTDAAIKGIQSGLDLVGLWRLNPRIVAHFGKLRLEDMIRLQELTNYRLKAENSSPKESVTGFSSAVETAELLPRHPSRVSRDDSVARSERDTGSDLSHPGDSENTCFACETLGQDVCHVHGNHLLDEEE